MTAVLRSVDGTAEMLDLPVWRAEPDAHELGLLAGLEDPVLDIGCGPGRVAAALAGQGRLALGIDSAPSAVREARGRGATALQRSVFRPLPGEGRWATLLLLDGNVGIGGEPVGLLRRCRQLVRPAGGVVVAELHGPGAPTTRRQVRVERDERAGPWFWWASVGVDGWEDTAGAAGLEAAPVERIGGRWFGRAARP